MSKIKIFVSRGWAPIRLGTLTRALPLLLVLGVLIMAGALGQAQSNFTVIHTFTGPDGANPSSGPTLDGQGNLYGSTTNGGTYESGNVYELAHVSGSWILHSLYSFAGNGDGQNPWAGVTIGPDGTLFGTIPVVLVGQRYGTMFNVKPPAHAVCATARCPGTELILHYFAGQPSDGAGPYGGVVFDPHGNLYGTTRWGGTYDAGAVYRATLSGGTWNVSVIYSFGGSSNDGYWPFAEVVLDSAGNLYGTTFSGGAYGDGTVFELSPSAGGWSETILHSFTESGAYPQGGLIFDRAGNLYGATGTMIFELSPQGGGWNFTPIYSFYRSGSYSTLAIDAAGNLYGTAPGGGPNGHGSVFELSPLSGGGWTYTDLYDFTGGADGLNPNGPIAIDAEGNLYGTTRSGGTMGYCLGRDGGCGTVWKLTR